MLELNLNTDTSISIINGNFPLGQNEVVKLNLLDDTLNQTIKIIPTGNVNTKENNYYSYGNFDNVTDIDKLIITELNETSTLEIVNGSGTNYSRCLHYKTENSEGFGIVNLFPDISQEYILGETYVFSCYLKGDTTIYVEDENENTLHVISNEGNEEDWIFYRIEIPNTIVETQFNTLNFFIETMSEGYIDTVSLFNIKNEINEPELKNVVIDLSIDNPYQKIKPNKNLIINWEQNEETKQISIFINFPSITYVDYQYNILCNIKIFKNFSLVYKSESFVLNGHILPQ